MPGGAAPKLTGNITTPTGTMGTQKPAASAGLKTYFESFGQTGCLPETFYARVRCLQRAAHENVTFLHNKSLKPHFEARNSIKRLWIRHLAPHQVSYPQTPLSL